MDFWRGLAIYFIFSFPSPTEGLANDFHERLDWYNQDGPMRRRFRLEVAYQSCLDYFTANGTMAVTSTCQLDDIVNK